MKILWLLIMFSFLTSCFSPQKYGNKEKIVKSMAESLTKQFGNVEHMSIEKYIELKKAGESIVLVDVRPEKERKVGFIPESISREEFEKNQNSYANATIVAYCTIGHRSSEYVQKLEKGKFKGTFNLKESILGWTHRQLPIVNADGPTKKVHVYGEPWNLVHDNYEGIIE